MLAATLRTEPELAWRLLGAVQIPERGDLTIDTEVLVSEGERGRVDLELRIGDNRGDLKTVWIEAKTFARFQQRQRGARPEHQLMHYRRALDRSDGGRQRAGAARSSLIALVHSVDRDVDRAAVAEAQAHIITWQLVADTLGAYAVEAFGPDWRGRGAAPDAGRVLSTLETLLWFLENAEGPDGRKYVGVSPSAPLTSRSLKLYGEAQSVSEAVVGLGDRIRDGFMMKGWKTKASFDAETPLTYEGLLQRGPGRALR
ncbi:MAG: hypothetical protein M3071_04040 [Actinomycetota bacterium]|nr:hypothetical protein [Actinomycetota bacterium]